MEIKTDVAIVGAGLAGLVAAIRLVELGYDVILVDASLPEAQGAPGGFAKFSGAKFSLPPAGMGLLSVASTEENLWTAIDRAETILGLDFSEVRLSADKSPEMESLREYRSLVLSPAEIDDLLYGLTANLSSMGVKIIEGQCTKLVLNSTEKTVHISSAGDETAMECDCIFYAGGRLGTDLLLNLGIEPTNVKGLDVGVRVEFADDAGLKKLRALGPDAKIIQGNCRTFCLNVPGKIFRYPFEEISIPGGIVASDKVAESNVGILYRSGEKSELLDRIFAKANSIPVDELEKPYKAIGTAFGDAEDIVRVLYGNSIAEKLNLFCKYLYDKELINWNIEHLVHVPLIDWHWSTFSKPGTFATSNNALFCLGDSSGHARGLLQAAVSGLLAAEEYDNAT